MSNFVAADRQPQNLEVNNSAFTLFPPGSHTLSEPPLPGQSASFLPGAGANPSPLQEVASLQENRVSLAQDSDLGRQSIAYDGKNTSSSTSLFALQKNSLAPLPTSTGISAANTPNLARSPKMPAGIIAANGLNSNGQLTLVGESRIFANSEVTINNTSGFNPNNIVRGSNVTTLNVGSLNLAQTNTPYQAYVPSFDGLVDKAISDFKPDINSKGFHLKSGTPDSVKRYEHLGNLTLPSGIPLSNMEIWIKAGGTLNVNGKVDLNNVKIFVEEGNANLGDLQATNSQILVAGAINMNGGARFAGKSLLATKNGGIQFNGATLSTGENDYVELTLCALKRRRFC
jgi:hypothetical protein